MAIINLFKETLFNESLPISVAKQYTKQGKNNYENLPKVITDAYDKMFGSKQRIHLGDVKIPIDETQFVDANNLLSDLYMQIYKSSNDADTNNNLPFKMVNIRTDNPQAINMEFDSDIIAKEFSQAQIPNNGGYLLKTVIKNVRKFVKKELYPNIQQMSGKLLTKCSDIKIVDSAKIILSKHPYDVAGMSQGKRWVSCKKAISDDAGPKGCNSNYLDSEVGHLLIAFIANPNIKSGKDMLSDPYARLLVLPVRDEDDFGLYVSEDIYSSGVNDIIKRNFYNIVQSFVSNFIKTFTSQDDKKLYSDYYADSSFMDMDRIYELMFDAILDAIDSIRKITRYAPEKFYDIIKDTYSIEFFTDNDIGYVDIPEYILNELPEHKLKAVDIVFEYLDMLNEDLDEYISTYMEDNLDRYMQYVGDGYDTVKEYLTNHPDPIDDSEKFFQLGKTSIIDGVLEFINDIVLYNSPNILENSSVTVGFVEYVISNMNNIDASYWTSENEWKDTTDIVKMWKNYESRIHIDYIEFKDFYTFLRIVGYTHDHIEMLFADEISEVSERVKNSVEFYIKK